MSASDLEIHTTQVVTGSFLKLLESTSGNLADLKVAMLQCERKKSCQPCILTIVNVISSWEEEYREVDCQREVKCWNQRNISPRKLLGTLSAVNFLLESCPCWEKKRALLDIRMSLKGVQLIT